MRFLVGLFAVLLLAGQMPQKGTIERFKVHGTALVGNLAGDPPARTVHVYLPPSYRSDKDRRYPVVYFLHDFEEDSERWFEGQGHWINLPYVMDRSLAGGRTREMILVMPDANTRFHGSMYSNSATTGDWEFFIARELVGYIDSRYRTIPRPESRGIAGHGMGGYGALRLAMKFPRTFSAVHALSPCCLVPNMNLQLQPGAVAGALRVKSFADIGKADFGTRFTLASAAAWSPNPQNPPFFLDLPWKDGVFQPHVAAKWSANALLAIVDQHISNLKRLRGIGFDAGDKDVAVVAGVRALDQVLSGYGVAHDSDIYSGNHTSHVPDRIEKQALPFFTRSLSFRP
jgi:enterochelin esterase-like enzyme